jgi:UPF0755 protein
MRSRNISAIILIAVIIGASSFSFYIYQVLYSPNILIGKEPVFLNIPTGSDFSDVQRIIAEQEIAGDEMAFSFLAKLMKYDKNVKPGRYRIDPGLNNRKLIQLLRSGQQSPVRITFNNIRLLDELPDKICRDLEMKSEDLLAYIRNPKISEKYGFDQDNFLGMFIPNTYEVYWDITKEELLERMKKEYQDFWSNGRLEKCREIGMTAREVTVLASIVKAECYHKEEAPVIAGLYINRIKKNMLLQADPTVVYANGDFTIHRVLDKHKEIDSPYNTYRYIGLPPGPINMPEILYLEAVLNYAKHEYLYMCAKDDFSDYHNFTSSYSEHIKNARRYSVALNREKIFK